MGLVRIHKQFPTTNELWELEGPSGPRLVKVYVGDKARQRRDRERQALLAWREAGFAAPEVFDVELAEFGGRGQGQAQPRPYLVMSYVQGRSLRSILQDGTLDGDRKLAAWKAVLAEMSRRHDRAIADGRVALVHPDSNSGNVMLADGGGVFFLDLEAAPKVGRPTDAAAGELAKLCRWAIRDLGVEHGQAILQAAAAAYGHRRDLLVRICRDVLGRPMQFFHRWRDRRRKAARPGEVTKYDVADGLARLLGL
jgi:Ser/Thr protein kinase RdoA (MazF antagonist)